MKRVGEKLLITTVGEGPNLHCPLGNLAKSIIMGQGTTYYIMDKCEGGAKILSDDGVEPAKGKLGSFWPMPRHAGGVMKKRRLGVLAAESGWLFRGAGSARPSSELNSKTVPLFGVITPHSTLAPQSYSTHCFSSRESHYSSKKTKFETSIYFGYKHKIDLVRKKRKVLACAGDV